MYLANQSNTQVYSPFGSYVVEQHDKGFDTGRRFYIPEPTFSSLPTTQSTDVVTQKVA